MDPAKGKGSFCGSLLTLGFSIFSIWLIFHKSKKPVCSIQTFRVEKTAGSSGGNANISFDLKLDNEDWSRGIYYDALNITLFANRTLPVGSCSFPGFYQGHGKATNRRATVVTGVSGLPNGVFRLDLATAVRYKMTYGWKTSKRGLVVGADVEVDDSGEKVNKKAIRLSSSAPEPSCYRTRFGIFAPLIFVSLIHAIV
ncbi:hypothetical protein NMG60_11002257 [Bertholletia excelsa]